MLGSLLELSLVASALATSTIWREANGSESVGADGLAWLLTSSRCRCAFARIRPQRYSPPRTPSVSFPSRMFSATETLGRRDCSWCTIATPRDIASEIEENRISSPRNCIDPRSGRWLPLRIFRSVDFPAPFSPMRPRTSFRRISRSTVLRALTTPKVFETPVSFRATVSRDARTASTSGHHPHGPALLPPHGDDREEDDCALDDLLVEAAHPDEHHPGDDDGEDEHADDGGQDPAASAGEESPPDDDARDGKEHQSVRGANGPDAGSRDGQPAGQRAACAGDDERGVAVPAHVDTGEIRDLLAATDRV